MSSHPRDQRTWDNNKGADYHTAVEAPEGGEEMISAVLEAMTAEAAAADAAAEERAAIRASELVPDCVGVCGGGAREMISAALEAMTAKAAAVAAAAEERAAVRASGWLQSFEPCSTERSQPPGC